MDFLRVYVSRILSSSMIGSNREGLVGTFSLLDTDLNHQIDWTLFHLIKHGLR
jgi:hypothetical protein